MGDCIVTASLVERHNRYEYIYWLIYGIIGGFYAVTLVALLATGVITTLSK